MNPTTDEMVERSAEREKATEVRRLRRLLKDIGDLAQHASLTGSLQGGAATAVRRYNAVVRRLTELGAISPGLFSPISDESSFDELGVEATLLSGYLKEDEPPANERGGNKSGNNSAPFINIVGPLGSMEGMDQLKDLGKVIRDSLPEWVKNRTAPPGLPEDVPAPPTPPTPPTPPAGRAGDVPQPMPDLSGINR